MNALFGDAAPSDELPTNAPDSPLTAILQGISADLGDREIIALVSGVVQNPQRITFFGRTMNDAKGSSGQGRCSLVEDCTTRNRGPANGHG